MYEKEIEDLKKNIKINEKLIDRIEADNKFKKRLMVIIMVLSVALGLGIASFTAHPLAFFLMSLVPGTFLSAEIYDKGIIPNQRKIGSYNNKIDSDIADIERYENEAQRLGRAQKYTRSESKNSYKFSEETVKAEREFEKYIDGLKEEGFFQDMDDNHKKR